MGMEKEKKVTIEVSIDPELYEALQDIARKKKGKSPREILEKKLEKLEAEDPEIWKEIFRKHLAEVTRKDVRIARLTKEDHEAIKNGELKFSWER